MSIVDCFKIPKIPRQSKLVQQIKAWKFSALNYTLASFITLVWFCDWRLICDRIPYYRGKYPRGVPRKYSIEPTYY